MDEIQSHTFALSYTEPHTESHLAQRLSSLEIERTTRVRNWDETDCVPFRANALGKDVNPSGENNWEDRTF